MKTIIEGLPKSDTSNKSSVPQREKILNKNHIVYRILGFLAFAIPLFLYYKTTCPVIYFGDAGELIVAAWRGGVAHPPGYPLYVILLAIFLRLPLQFLAPDSEFFQPIAWQANLMSSLLGAATIWVVYLILLRLIKNPWWALGGALVAATGKTFWSQTGIAEVYTLNALLACILILQGILITDSEPGSKRRIKLFYWASLTWGLSLSNHHEMIFFGFLWVAMLFFTLQKNPYSSSQTVRPSKIILSGILYLAIGLTPYIYLPVASAFNPVLNWGHPSNIVNFLKVLTRAEYRGIKTQITSDLINSWDILSAFLRWSFIQNFPVYLLLVIPGLSVFFRKSNYRGIILCSFLSILLMNIAFIIYFSGIDRGSLFFLEVYFIPWYIFLAILSATGCATIFTAGQAQPARFSPINTLIAFIILIALAGGSGYVNFRQSNMSDNIAGYVYSHDVLATLPPAPQKSILLTGGDEIFLFWYWQWVEGIDKEIACIGIEALEAMRSWFWKDLLRHHPDLKVPDREKLSEKYELNELRWRTLDELLRANHNNYRSFMLVWDPRLDPLLHKGPWHMVIDGPIIEIERDTTKNIGDYPRASVPEESYLFKKLLEVNRSGLDPMELEIYNRYTSACYNMAVYFSQSGEAKKAARFASLCIQFNASYDPGERAVKPRELLAYNLYKAGDFELAKELLQELIKSDPKRALYRAYLAEVYRALGDLNAAKRELEIALQIEPTNQFVISLYREILGNKPKKTQ